MKQNTYGTIVRRINNMSYMEPITIEEFKEAMPVHIRKNINPELIDVINTAISDPEQLAVFRENVNWFNFCYERR